MQQTQGKEEKQRYCSAGEAVCSLQIQLKNLHSNYDRLKYACAVTDNQLTEVEAMLEPEQKRNKTHQEKIDNLDENMRKTML